MYIEQIIRINYGLLVITSLALAIILEQPWWLLLALFASLSMIQSAITGICPQAMILRKLGVPSAPNRANAKKKATTTVDKLLR